MGVTDTGGKGIAGLTPRQQKWFATVKANFEAKSGKPLEEWVTIARTCPETAPRKRVEWLRENHGLGVNHAAFVLGEAFPSEGPSWDDPEALRAQLWSDPASLKIFEAIERCGDGLDGLVTGHRKSFSSFSKDVQFAATRPLKGARALLGLKLDPAISGRLSPSVRRESWSERLTAIVEFEAPEQVDGEVRELFAKAYERG
jgi:hypothetical protein